MKIYDISPPLSPKTAGWPGDTPFEQWKLQSFSKGDSFNLGSIRLSLHAGSHMDAPCHYLRDGATIDQIPLERCIGAARLVTLTGEDTISASRLEKLSLLQEGFPERLLIRLCPVQDVYQFPSHYSCLSTEAAQLLSESRIQLLGVDTPSVDREDSKELLVHHKLGQAGILILENLLLKGVPDGDYELVALPLKVEGGDGSPVRAILRELPE